LKNPDEGYHPRLTRKQRFWILERDDYQCQFIILNENNPRKCGKTTELCTHHITPVDWGYELLKEKPEEVNKAENIITLCEMHFNMVHLKLG